MPWNVQKSEDNLESYLSSFTVWVLGIELKSSGLTSKSLYLLSYLAKPVYIPLTLLTQIDGTYLI